METDTVDRFEEYTNTLNIPKTKDLPYLDYLARFVLTILVIASCHGAVPFLHFV